MTDLTLLEHAGAELNRLYGPKDGRAIVVTVQDMTHRESMTVCGPAHCAHEPDEPPRATGPPGELPDDAAPAPPAVVVPSDTLAVGSYARRVLKILERGDWMFAPDIEVALGSKKRPQRASDELYFVLRDLEERRFLESDNPRRGWRLRHPDGPV